MAVPPSCLLVPFGKNRFRVHGTNSEVVGSPALVGAKAAGLALIPPRWRPNFVVVANLGDDDLVGDGLLAGAAATCCELLKPGEPQMLIVRSNFTDEEIPCRGAYDSKRTRLDPREVVEAISAILRQRVSTTVLAEQRSSVIVQEYVDEAARGHLSNERRVAVDRIHFVYEVLQTGAQMAAAGIKVGVKSFELRGSILSPSEDKAIRGIPGGREFLNALKLLGRWVQTHLGRAHVEWVWRPDSSLAVVQCDKEAKTASIPPLSEWVATRREAYSGDLRVFRTARPEDCEVLRKSSSQRDFAACGLPTASLYMLDVSKHLELSRGILAEEVIEDLRTLVSPRCPAVVRLDVSKDVVDWTNLPASPPLEDPAIAGAFVLNSLQVAVQRKIVAERLAVVVHHFIPSVSSAWVECLPNSPRVRVDAIWGHPDGLQGFPCDTYWVDLDSGEVLEHCRYKDEFLDVDALGNLVSRKAGWSWDRGRVLEREVAVLVGRESRRVAVHRGGACRVMWFIGVDRRLGAPPNQPWIVTAIEEQQVDRYVLLGEQWRTPAERSGRKWVVPLSADRRMVVRSMQDVDELRTDPKAFEIVRKRLLFRPNSVEGLRDKNLVRAVAGVAQELGWRIVFEGSVLSHAYYLLRAAGVDVECAHEFTKPPRTRRIRKLVRDLVPDRIKSNGEDVAFRKLPQELKASALKRKLVEEALEVHRERKVEAVTEELADLHEVMTALAKTIGIEWTDVIEVAEKKRRVRGGFDEGYYLTETAGHAVARDERRRAGRVPVPVRRLRDSSGIVVQLVPPPADQRLWEGRLRVGAWRVWLEVEYRDNEVLIRLSERNSEHDGQLSLPFGGGKAHGGTESD